MTNNKDRKSIFLTLDKQITIGFIAMLILIVFISFFCLYTIKNLKNSQTDINGKSVSIFKIIEESAEDTVFDNKMLMDAIKVADKEIGIAYINVVIVALISIFFGGLITLLFPKKVTNPVFQLIKATREAKKGEYSYRVPDIKGSNEISMLINSLNSMLKNLEEKQIENEHLLSETKKFNETLENKVKEVEIELKETSSQLAKNERLAEIGQIVFKIAHEVRNPLSGISIALENLESDIENQDNKILIKEIISEIKRLDNIIRDLFQIAIPNHIELDEADPIKIIDKAVNLVRYKKDPENTNIIIENKYSPKDLNIKLKLDKDQILQVLINILLNAIDSIENKNGKVIIDAEDSPDYFQISISDNGKGIKDKDAIFQPFYTTKKDGSGLGLSISQTIIEKHEGKLLVDENRLEEGSVFIIKLPK